MKPRSIWIPLGLSMMANSKIPISQSQIGLIRTAFSCQRVVLVFKIQATISLLLYINILDSLCDNISISCKMLIFFHGTCIHTVWHGTIAGDHIAIIEQQATMQLVTAWRNDFIRPPIHPMTAWIISDEIRIESQSHIPFSRVSFAVPLSMTSAIVHGTEKADSTFPVFFFQLNHKRSVSRGYNNWNIYT